MKISVDFELPDDTFASLVTKEYLEQRIKEVLGGVITPPTDPIKPLCKEGPKLEWIKQLTTKKIQANFYGKDIFEIYYIITKDGKLVQDGTFVPKNDVPIIDLTEPLTKGIYNLKFVATLCLGESDLDFIVK